MPIDAIHHAGITVRDIERSIAFYRDALGLELQFVVDRTGKDISDIVGYENCTIRLAFLRIPGQFSRIELLQYLAPTGTPREFESRDPATGHVCFAVHDIHALAERISSAGGTLRSPEPVMITSGPNTGTLALYVRDPDGYVIELLQPSTS
jgi:catechol 2,3-dioxygenase-like lactoylglutathione lyase family enzyme